MKPIELQISELTPHLRRYARILMRGDLLRAYYLVQDSIERALQHSNLWQRGTNLRAWLFTIMHNLHVNQIRRSSNGPDFVELNSEYSDEQQSADSRAIIGDIQQALNTLPTDQREILLFVSIEGMKYQDVARILDIPEGTVMSRLARARSRLRQALSLDRQLSIRRVK